MKTQPSKKEECELCSVDERVIKQLKEEKSSFRKSHFYLIPLAILIAALIVAVGIIFKEKIPSPQKTSSISPLNSEKKEAKGDFKPVIGSYAPFFTLKTARGIEISLEDLRGQNVLVVFWATWCPFCAQELPDLKKFTEIYRGQIIVLAIDIKESAQVIREYEEREGINFTMLLDENGEVTSQYWVDGTPSHFFINKEGKIIATWPGYSSLVNLENLAKKLLESK